MADEESVQEPVEEAEPTAPECPIAVLFELEGVAVQFRKKQYEALEGILSNHGGTLTPILFSRYALHPSPTRFLPALLDALGLDASAADSIAGEYAAAVEQVASAGEVEISDRFAGLQKELAKRDIPMAAISGLPQKVADTLMERMGFAEHDIRMKAFEPNHQEFPGADTWLTLAKEIERPARRCLVLASTQSSCKASLSAGMRCVALPDEYTGYQDFGGALLILELDTDMPPAEVLDLSLPSAEPAAVS